MNNKAQEGSSQTIKVILMTLLAVLMGAAFLYFVWKKMSGNFAP